MEAVIEKLKRLKKRLKEKPEDREEIEREIEELEKELEAIKIFEKRGATEDVMAVVKGIYEAYKLGTIDAVTAFYALLGVAYYHIVPLTPRDIKKLKEAFGIAV